MNPTPQVFLAFACFVLLLVLFFRHQERKKKPLSWEQREARAMRALADGRETVLAIAREPEDLPRNCGKNKERPGCKIYPIPYEDD